MAVVDEQMDFDDFNDPEMIRQQREILERLEQEKRDRELAERMQEGANDRNVADETMDVEEAARILGEPAAAFVRNGRNMSRRNAPREDGSQEPPNRRLRREDRPQPSASMERLINLHNSIPDDNEHVQVLRHEDDDVIELSSGSESSESRASTPLSADSDDALLDEDVDASSDFSDDFFESEGSSVGNLSDVEGEVADVVAAPPQEPAIERLAELGRNYRAFNGNVVINFQPGRFNLVMGDNEEGAYRGELELFDIPEIPGRPSIRAGRRAIENLVARGHRPNAVRTDEYGECTMCFDTPSDPLGCNQCKQHLGCKICVNRWFLTSSAGGGRPGCPLCRNRWGLKPQCTPMDRVGVVRPVRAARGRGRGRGRGGANANANA